jgi:cytochrome P450
MRRPNNLVERPVAAAFVSCGVALVARITWQYIRYWRSPLHKIPGPSDNSFWWGNFFDVFNEPFLDPHKRWWKAAGYDVPLLRYWGVLGVGTVVVLDKDIVKEILTAPQERFGRLTAFLKNLIGEGLVTTEGQTWKRHRLIIQPAFHTNLLKTLLSNSVPTRVKGLADCWNKTVGHEIDVDSHLSALTLDVIGDVAFGHNFGAIDTLATWAHGGGKDDNMMTVDDPFVRALKNTLNFNPFTIVCLVVFRMPKLDVWLNPSFKRTRRLLNQATDQLIENAKKNATGSSGGAPKSLINILLEAKGQDTTNKYLSDLELRDETKTFVIAGHETTSTWCYWAIFALTKHPEVQERVYQDIVRHAPLCAVTGGSDGIHDLDTLEKMEYFNAFLNEVLRMYPPAGVMPRLTLVDETLAGYTIPAFTRLLIPIHLLHRHPKYWKDPNEFQPERWLVHKDKGGNNEGADASAQVRSAFLPFSAGSRNCIGHRFASIEAKLIMAPLIRSFMFQVAPSRKDTEFTFTSFVTMKTKPSFRACVQARE